MTRSSDSTRWDRLAALFEAAHAVPPHERTIWLARCAEDAPDLVDDLREMLADGDAALALEGWIDAASEEPSTIGRDIGPYRLVRPIGRGGMGEVYLAERRGGTYDQRVALKMLKAGVFGTAAVARFDRERRILARLTHPAIVPLLDGGVAPDGRPYLVLQYVDGAPITVDADRRRLDVRARLRQFLAVCRAAHFAHTRLVIHRDLKPSNILVSEEGDVRLLDFGIGKILEADDDDAGATREQGLVLTPSRAAPEQFRGDPPSAATDVWALGVLLFELLTGRLPHDIDDTTAPEAVLARLTREVTKPSRVVQQGTDAEADAVAHARDTTRRALARQLRGDLDTIVLKALQPDPVRRYDSVQALAQDIDAWLDGRPVTARPDTRRYRLGRFVGRHRVGVALATAAGLTILGAAGVAVRQAQSARAAQREAEGVAAFMSRVLFEANIDAPASQSTLLVADLLQRVHQDIGTLDASAAVQVRLLNQLADALRSFGRQDGYEDATTDALRIAQSALPAAHPDRVRAELLRGEALNQRGRPTEARPLLAGLIARLPEGPGAASLDLTRAWRALADGWIVEGKLDDARRDATRAVAIGERLLRQPHAETAAALRTLAEALMAAHAPETLATTERALALTLAAHAGQPSHPWVLSARELRAKALGDAGRVQESVEELERALVVRRALQGPMSRSVGVATHNLAGNQMRIGRYREALVHNAAAIAIVERHVDPTAMDLINIRAARGQMLVQLRRGAEAADVFAVAIPPSIPHFGATDTQSFNLRAMQALAHAYAGRRDAALRDAARLDDDMRRAHVSSPRAGLFLGRLHRALGQPAAARARLEAALAAFGPTPSASQARDVLQVRVECALLDLDVDPVGAETALRAAVATHPSLFAVPTPFLVEAHLGLARLAARRGAAADARAHAATAESLGADLDAAPAWFAEVRAARARLLRALGPA